MKTSKSRQADELDPHERDEHLRERRAHPAVPLGLDDAHGPRLGDSEVRPRDADLRGEELLAQVKPRGVGQVLGVVGKVLLRRVCA